MLIYAPNYNYGFWGLERLHPFDSRKFSKAFSLLRRRFGAGFDRSWRAPEGPVRDEELCLIHG